jgi:ubiquitin-conjugating enzyme E2 S
MNSSNEYCIPPQMINALYKQEIYLKNNPINGISYYFNENDITDIQADIEGPTATPYEGGIFRVKIKIPYQFPNNAPKGIFLTKIFHPNISEQGEICVNTLKRDWDPKNWSLSNLFQVIRCLLIIPFPQSALNEEAGKLFMEDYSQFFKIAKIFTSIHAKPSNTSKESNKDGNDSDDIDDSNKKNDIYSTPVKKHKKNKDKYESDFRDIRINLKLMDFDTEKNKINSENKANYKNNCKLDMYSLMSIKKNISVSDSKNKKEEIEKWIKRI